MPGEFPAQDAFGQAARAGLSVCAYFARERVGEIRIEQQEIASVATRNPLWPSHQTRSSSAACLGRARSARKTRPGRMGGSFGGQFDARDKCRMGIWHDVPRSP
jgi:hypothetical protein